MPRGRSYLRYTVDRGPGKPRRQTSYGAAFRGVPPEEPHIPGHLQRTRHLEGRKNPLLPSAMEINDVQRDVRFVCYDNFWRGVWARGTFMDSATTQPLPRGYGLKLRGLWAKVRLEDGQLAFLSLSGAGIIKMAAGGYMDHATVSPKHEHLLPNPNNVPERCIKLLRDNHMIFPSRLGL